MDMKKEYMTPEACIVECSAEVMLISSWVDEDVNPGEEEYGGQFQSNKKRAWGSNGLW